MDGFLLVIGFALVVAAPSFMLGLAVGQRQIISLVERELRDEALDED